MANHKSAAKRARQDEKRHARNRQITTRVRTAVKKLHTALKNDEASEASGALRTAESLIRRAASKGVIPKSRASRSISRLMKAANQLSAN